jgi:hypothetical protein
MQLLNTRVFDETAVGWEATIDKSIQKERYLRASFLFNAAVEHINLNASPSALPNS